MRTYSMIAIVVVLLIYVARLIATSGLFSNDEDHKAQKHLPPIRIAGSTPAVLERTKPALTYCRENIPSIEVDPQDLNAKLVIKSLQSGHLDIGLLSKEEGRLVPNGLFMSMVEKKAGQGENPAQSAEDSFVIAWNPSRESRQRDRVIHIIQNEPYMMQHGYCDYR